jgi:hypothetical protein
VINRKVKLLIYRARRATYIPKIVKSIPSIKIFQAYEAYPQINQKFKNDRIAFIVGIKRLYK